MNITIEYSSPDDILEQIAQFLERAAATDRQRAMFTEGKIGQRKAEYSANEIEALASYIRKMSLVRIEQ